MKKNLFLIVTIVISLFVSGCSKKTEQKEKAFVAILKDNNIGYWHQVARGFEEQCKARGYESVVLFTENESDASAQVNIVSSLENTQFDICGIALAPIWSETDRSAEQAVADFAKKKGIPVTVVDSPIDPATSPLKDVYVSYVGTDNTAAGQDLAKHVSGSAGSILVVRDENSTPTMERYQGFCAEKGNVELWNTNTSGIADIVGHIGSDISSIVFLNGHLCAAVIEKIGNYNVYSFDLYSEYVSLLAEDSFFKGALAQNSIGMGRECVNDLISKPQTKNHFIPAFYFDKETFNNPSSEAAALLESLQ